ncbi:hypothetical protein VNO78_06639 [Psophocarpus tetragonolobus]|uniref:GIR1-like zinc ribbon domain-containing protein n=1 Tax=Psophocarpus tetragonolobus TaxID=3891 RepID=A0AAN9XR98_PSOTE
MVTCNLFGGSSSNNETMELDLDLQVPSGWEKCLDLKSGKLYIQRNNSLGSPSVMDHKFQMNREDEKLEDLNFSPFPSRVSLNSFNEINMVSSSLPSSNYQSVCTLDKVRLALERAEKDPVRKRELSLKSSSVSYSSSIRGSTKEEENEEKNSSPIVAGCSNCLSYVVVMKHNPKCPKCNHGVSVPLAKKPKNIDLNISI